VSRVKNIQERKGLPPALPRSCYVQFLADFGARQFGPQEPNHDAGFIVVHECKDVRATLAEPVVVHAVESDGQSLGRSTDADGDLIGSEAEELTACEPVEFRGTRGICALWVRVLAERKIGYGLAVRRVLVVLD
jgi:hypothetical protein